MKIENLLRITETLGSGIFEGYNINHVSRKSGIDVATTHRMLKQMERRNEVVKTKRGNNVFYTLNLRNSATLKYCELASIESRKRLLSVHPELLDPLERLKREVDSVVIFGSLARGEREPRDVDLLLLFDKKPRVGKMQKTLPARFSPIYMEFGEFGEKIRNMEKLVLEIVRDAVVISGEDKYWKALRDVS